MNQETLDAIERIHTDVELQARMLSRRHAERLQCRLGCSACCKDDLTVFEVEAELIAARHPEVLKQAPHPAGACAFLNSEGSCRVYASRPYVCRTQGLPLRWIDRVLADDGVMEVFEYRDICHLNDIDPPIEILDASDFWTIGPTEERLIALQETQDDQKRISLRSLFERGR